MPVSPREASGRLDPLSGCMVYPHDLSLTANQFNVLKALMPKDATQPAWEWPMWNRAQLGKRAGFTAVSGSLTRVLNGIKLSNWTSAVERGVQPSGKPHPGLLARGFITEVTVELDSRNETNYQATPAGVRAYEAHVASGRRHIPRDKASSVNTDRGYRNPHLSAK